MKSKSKSKSKIWKIVASIIAVLLVIVIAGLVWLRMSIYPARDDAVEAYNSSNVSETSQYIKFDAPHETANIVFVGGALVDLKAYSYMAEELSKDSIDVYLVKSPYSLPILNAQSASHIISSLHLTNVYLAGHSLGGVMAAANIKNGAHIHQLHVQGLIFLASYPNTDNDLSKTHLHVLSLTASHDTVLNRSQWNKARQRLPHDTSYREIKGGNHAGFGIYGAQKGDGKATISVKSQQRQIIQSIVETVHKK
ncbi:alpha/beta hydrolase [Alloscardovia venturai]|uniref:Alpha/beta hydrolase n=1 Tax=Alloscardovia venturai TaxID=1769421 RepID=A0ABW2Y8C8_9BIFI